MVVVVVVVGGTCSTCHWQRRQMQPRCCSIRAVARSVPSVASWLRFRNRPADTGSRHAARISALDRPACICIRTDGQGWRISYQLSRKGTFPNARISISFGSFVEWELDDAMIFYYQGEALPFHATLLLGTNELDFAVISRCLPRNRFAGGMSFLLSVSSFLSFPACRQMKAEKLKQLRTTDRTTAATAAAAATAEAAAAAAAAVAAVVATTITLLHPMQRRTPYAEHFSSAYAPSWFSVIDRVFIRVADYRQTNDREREREGGGKEREREREREKAVSDFRDRRKSTYRQRRQVELTSRSLVIEDACPHAWHEITIPRAHACTCSSTWVTRDRRSFNPIIILFYRAHDYASLPAKSLLLEDNVTVVLVWI